MAKAITVGTKILWTDIDGFVHGSREEAIEASRAILGLD